MADTGLLSPAANGLVDAEWTTPANAYASDNAYASPGSASLQHDYYNFSPSIPAGATIDGIEVSLEGYAYNAVGALIGVEISWDSGVHYTATGYAAAYPDTSEETDVLGGAADTWGRAWAVSEFANGTLVVRIDSTGSGTRPYLDHLQVRVTYTEAAGGIVVLRRRIEKT